MDVTQARLPLAKAYTALAATHQAQFDAAAAKADYASFRNVLLDKPATPTLAQLNSIRTELEKTAAIKGKIQEFDK